MRIVGFSLLVVAGVSIAVGARAQTAREVRDGVVAEDPQVLALLVGTVSGVVAMDRGLREEGKARLFCPDAGQTVSLDALEEMVEAAGALDLPFEEAVIEGFRVRYPCPAD